MSYFSYARVLLLMCTVKITQQKKQFPSWSCWHYNEKVENTKQQYQYCSEYSTNGFATGNCKPHTISLWDHHHLEELRWQRSHSCTESWPSHHIMFQIPQSVGSLLIPNTATRLISLLLLVRFIQVIFLEFRAFRFYFACLWYLPCALIFFSFSFIFLYCHLLVHS